jgi:hypothetical protein
MPNYLEADTTRVATGPWYLVEVARSAENWDLGSAGFAADPEVVTVEYPDQASMAAADRPLGFGVAMAHAVEIVHVERGQ